MVGTPPQQLAEVIDVQPAAVASAHSTVVLASDLRTSVVMRNSLGVSSMAFRTTLEPYRSRSLSGSSRTPISLAPENGSGSHCAYGGKSTACTGLRIGGLLSDPTRKSGIGAFGGSPGIGLSRRPRWDRTSDDALLAPNFRAPCAVPSVTNQRPATVRGIRGRADCSAQSLRFNSRDST